MEPIPRTKVESFNALVRAGVLIGLLAVLSFAYLWLLLHDKPVGALEGTIMSLGSGAFVWWFKSRDDEKMHAPKPPVQSGSTP